MMKLTIDSICLLSSILDKIQPDQKFIDELFQIGQTAKGQNNEGVESIKNKIGMKVIMKIGSQLHLVRDELVKFIASYKEISEEEAKKVDIVAVIKDLMNDEGFKSFLKQNAISK